MVGGDTKYEVKVHYASVQLFMANVTVEEPDQALAQWERELEEFINTAFASFKMVASPRKKRAEWDDTKDFFLIQHLQKTVRLGKKNDGGFKKDVWNDLTRQFNSKFGSKNALIAKQSFPVPYHFHFKV